MPRADPSALGPRPVTAIPGRRRRGAFAAGYGRPAWGKPDSSLRKGQLRLPGTIFAARSPGLTAPFAIPAVAGYRFHLPGGGSWSHDQGTPSGKASADPRSHFPNRGPTGPWQSVDPWPRHLPGVRYRGSKMCSGCITCGKSTRFGSGNNRTFPEKSCGAKDKSSKLDIVYDYRIGGRQKPTPLTHPTAAEHNREDATRFVQRVFARSLRTETINATAGPGHPLAGRGGAMIGC